MKTNRTNLHRILAMLAAGVIGGTAWAATGTPATATGATTGDSTAKTHSQAETKTSAQAWLGAAVEGRSTRHGQRTPKLRIVRVTHGSPADTAGLHEGDILAKFDGRAFTTARGLHQELRTLAPGASVPVEVWRHGRSLTATVKLGTAPMTAHHSAPHAHGARLHRTVKKTA